MFEHFDTPEEIFSFKLGAALTMENDTLTMLAELEATTSRPELKALFHEHAVETQQQVENLKRCFALLGEEVSENPSPVTKGLAKEATASIRKTDASIVDAVLLSGAVETEHYEIAVYEVLVTNAKARGADEVAKLLQQNLDQELAALQKVKDNAERISMAGIAYAPEGGLPGRE
jgi:ferritin-like metal-binding protein YciE